MLHSINFDKRYYSLKQALQWIKLHNYKPINKLGKETLNYYKFRINHKNKNMRYYTKKIVEGIDMVFQV